MTQGPASDAVPARWLQLASRGRGQTLIMIDIATHALRWNIAGNAGTVARFVDLQGFGGRRSNEAVAIAADGERFGSLLGGAADDAIAEAAATGRASVVTVSVADNDAVGCGLACGGRAEILVQPMSDIASLGWTAMARREPVVVATLLTGEHCGRSIAITHDGTLDGSLGDPAVTLEAVQAAQAMFTRPKDLSRTVMTDVGPVFVSLIRPATRVLIIGEATLADAMAAQGALVGWRTTILSDSMPISELVDAANSLGAGDALVALSHDLPASCATMAAALLGRCGYVGGLGSRHTQTARATRLAEVHSLDEQVIAEIHGPVGLDLGSRTPEETALAIAAEIVAALAGRTGASLRTGTGPING